MRPTIRRQKLCQVTQGGRTENVYRWTCDWGLEDFPRAVKCPANDNGTVRELRERGWWRRSSWATHTSFTLPMATFCPEHAPQARENFVQFKRAKREGRS